MTECFHDLSQARLRDSDNPFERYYDLIPVKDKDLLPTAQMTPCVHAIRLGEQLGLERLYLKNETENPTGTTKYRMAAVSLPYLYEAGVRHFCTSSTGNSSTAYAIAITAIPELRMSLFTGSDFRSRVNYKETDQVTHYVLNGASFAEAFEHAAVFAAQNGHTSERGFFNVGRREGLKLAWFEAVEQTPTPIDWYIQAVSSAMGVIGVYKGAKELRALGLSSRLPRLLCAQQDSCSPMVKAWSEQSSVIRPSHIVRQPRGIALAILRGDPSRAYPYVYRAVQESGGEMRAATQTEIREAQALVRDCEGIAICYSAATAVAAMVQRARLSLFRPDETIVVNLTGNDRIDAHVPSDFIAMNRSADGWVVAS